MDSVEENMAWMRLDLERGLLVETHNELCCELNPRIYCKGCGKKWCEEHDTRRWSDEDFDHQTLGGNFYKCPIADKVKNTYDMGPHPAILIPQTLK
jgi:hypothetical protein